jgi:disulfide oxidoreductase YuzD
MLWMMKEPVIVVIVGAPIACADGIKDTWREVAAWTEGQLKNRFDDQVQVEYFDLFDPLCPDLPENAELPVVFVNNAVVSNGGKISIPLIRKYIEAQVS